MMVKRLGLCWRWTLKVRLMYSTLTTRTFTGVRVKSNPNPYSPTLIYLDPDLELSSPCGIGGHLV